MFLGCLVLYAPALCYLGLYAPVLCCLVSYVPEYTVLFGIIISTCTVLFCYTVLLALCAPALICLHLYTAMLLKVSIQVPTLSCLLSEYAFNGAY